MDSNISNASDNSQKDNILENKGSLLNTTYGNMGAFGGAALENDEFYKYYYNLLQNSMNYCNFTNVRLVKTVEEDWVKAIEEALPSLYYTVMNPRKFIEEEREVVNIAMARNITSESLRHLIQHSDMIDKFDAKDGTVVPNRILNVFKEESYNIYENRFICTLLAELQMFVNKRYNVLFEISKDEIGTFYEYESRVESNSEMVEFKTQVKIRDKQTDVYNEKDNNDIFKRIIKIHRDVNSLVNTEFISTMRGYPMVKHPIIKTNVIGKNRYYKACHKLWNFIYSYSKIGYKVDVVKQEPIISRQFEKDMYNTMIWNYVMLQNQVETPLYIDESKKEQQRDFGIEQIRQLLSEIVKYTNMPDTTLRKIVNNELASIQNKRKNEVLKLEKIEKKRKAAAERETKRHQKRLQAKKKKEE
ncbi:MAG: DUF2357 domain-containing protein [Lachnospiraceae bacterium]|nr:DUF2357 domain-containing protein [Lachnospiraceae bacterium]